MIKSDKYWVTDGESFYDIKNPLNSIHFNWTGNYSGDYIQLSNAYFETARTVIAAILMKVVGMKNLMNGFFLLFIFIDKPLNYCVKGYCF